MALSDKELNEHIANRIRKYKGNCHELEKAIGCYFFGREAGWKVLLLVHDRKSVSKYEEILGLDFRKELPEVGKYAEKSMAWRLVQKVSSFWKAVKGEIPDIKTPELLK